MKIKYNKYLYFYLMRKIKHENIKFNEVVFQNST